MTLPLMTNALLRTGSEAAIGVIDGANTVGAIVGVLLAVHVLMPTVVVKGIILAGVLIHLSLGVSGMWRAGATFRRITPAVAIAAGGDAQCAPRCTAPGGELTSQPER